MFENSNLPEYLHKALGLDTYLESLRAFNDPNLAKALIQNVKCPAVALVKAVGILIGDEFREYEPETIKLELLQLQIDIPNVNWDKLLAAQALLETPSFYWEYLAFQNTISAFEGLRVVNNIVQEVTPAQISNGIISAELVRAANGLPILDFDNEPQGYTAVVLQRNCYVLAPPPLEFCQDAIDLKLNKEAKEMKSKVREALDSSLTISESTPLDMTLHLALYAVPYIHLKHSVREWQGQLK